MKKKIIVLIFLIFTILIIHQLYWYIQVGGNLQVFICNTSEKKSDIELYLDDKKIIDKSFNDNSYLSCEVLSFKVFPGNHRLVAKTSEGIIEKEFSVYTSLVTRVNIELINKNVNQEDSNNFDFQFVSEWIFKKIVIQ